MLLLVIKSKSEMLTHAALIAHGIDHSMMGDRPKDGEQIVYVAERYEPAVREWFNEEAGFIPGEGYRDGALLFFNTRDMS